MLRLPLRSLRQAPRAVGSFRAYHGPRKATAINFNNGVDKAWETKRLREIVAAPPSALQGLAPHTDEKLAELKIKTVADLGNWKFFRRARALVTMAQCEQLEGRTPEHQSNIFKGVDRAYEECSIAELLDAPPSALSGLAPWTDEVLAGVGINTVGQLGRWKFAHWAEALNILSEVESADDSS